MKIHNWPVERPVPYGRNPRAVPQKAIDKVAGSITEFGFRQPIVVDDKGVVIVGHTRLAAAKQLGLTKVPVHVAEGLSKVQAKAYRLADNRLNQDSGWDPELLGLEIGDLEGLGFDLDLAGFDPSELNALVSATEGATGEDAVPPPPERPGQPPRRRVGLWRAPDSVRGRDQRGGCCQNSPRCHAQPHGHRPSVWGGL